MAFRALIPLLLGTTLLICIFVGSIPPPACTDPLGCLWIGPGAPIQIGVDRVSSGAGQALSQEVYQGAQLAQEMLSLFDPHPLRIQSFYSACIPEMPAQSALDLAADDQLLVVLGPACPEQVENFQQRIVRAGHTLISPIPFLLSTAPDIATYTPDRQHLAAQAVEQFLRLGYRRPWVLASVDDLSQTWLAEVCAQLAQNQAACIAAPGTDPAPDVIVWLSLAPQPLFGADFPADPSLPVVFISLSTPQIAPDLSPTVQSWIGPAAWGDPAWLQSYQQRYAARPTSLAPQSAYAATAAVRRTAQKTAVVLQDGTWIIPRQAFSRQLAREIAQEGLFRFTCAGAGCPALPLATYPWLKNEYRFANP